MEGVEVLGHPFFVGNLQRRVVPIALETADDLQTPFRVLLSVIPRTAPRNRERFFFFFSRKEKKKETENGMRNSGGESQIFDSQCRKACAVLARDGSKYVYQHVHFMTPLLSDSYRR